MHQATVSPRPSVSRRSTRPAPATASAAPSSRSGCGETAIEETLTLANAAGALAVTRRGPMEGAFDLADAARLRRQAAEGFLMSHPLLTIPDAFHRGTPIGITSVCSAHPHRHRSRVASAGETGGQCLIEATCNQVNQDGGYTGMTPADFRQFVERIAAKSASTRHASSSAAITRSQPVEASCPPTRRWPRRRS